MAGLLDTRFALQLWAELGISMPNFFNTGAMGIFDGVLYICPGCDELLRRTPLAATTVGLRTGPSDGIRVLVVVDSPAGRVRYYGTTKMFIQWLDLVFNGNSDDRSGHITTTTSSARLPVAFQSALLAIYRFSARVGIPTNMNPDVMCMNTGGGVRLVGREPVAAFVSPVILHSMNPHPADFVRSSPLMQALVLCPALAMAIADCGLARNACERQYDFAVWNHMVAIIGGRELQFTPAELSILHERYGISSTADNVPTWTTKRHLFYQTVANVCAFAKAVLLPMLENCLSPNVHAPLGNAPLESVVVAVRHAMRAPGDTVHPSAQLESPILASNWRRMDIVRSAELWLGELLAAGDVYQVRVYLYSCTKNPNGFVYQTEPGVGYAEFAHFATRHLTKELALATGVSVFVGIDPHGSQTMSIYADPASLGALRTLNNIAAAVRRALPEAVDNPRLLISASAVVRCWWNAAVAVPDRDAPHPDVYDMLWVHALVPQHRQIRSDFLGLMADTCSNHLRRILHMVFRVSHALETNKMGEMLVSAVQCVRFLVRNWADAWDPDDAVRRNAIQFVESVSALFPKADPVADKTMVTVLAEHATARGELDTPHTVGAMDLLCCSGTGAWAADADVLRVAPGAARMLALFSIQSPPDLFVGCRPDRFRRALVIFVSACLGVFEPRTALTMSSIGEAPPSLVRCSHFVGLRSVATETSCAGDTVQTMAARFPLDQDRAREFFEQLRWLAEPA